VLLGSALVKVVCKMLAKLTPGPCCCRFQTFPGVKKPSNGLKIFKIEFLLDFYSAATPAAFLMIIRKPLISVLQFNFIYFMCWLRLIFAKLKLKLSTQIGVCNRVNH